MAQHNELGEKGEQLAIEYLEKNGYKILEKNYRYKKAEVDIITEKEAVLVVVEVKTRSSTYFGNPQDFVNPKKIKLLVYAMNHYVHQKNIDLEIRFDIIGILQTNNTFKIEHIEDAFLYF
ncbi:YraN family protein [Tenacibaculum piscium]|uniref:YraN family protein n=1 Tax=Tenacibaculum piscium TaxID=1458515 RepID=UPI001EFA40E9|nr:YraN family protein [Tenacibaculum piscium]MCG8183039.1 YraN family protein [Tenacibaculum piscium]MCG8204777.1 YraN family protein [Tenacibaculum piscium]